MRRSQDFRSTIRGGAVARCPLAVVYAATGSTSDRLVGFVVSKAVGNSVVRHTVTRRLRAVMAGHLATVPGGTNLVVRALPPAAAATYGELDGQVGRTLTRVLEKAR
jgi:ribonuclease P protein component